MFVLNENKTLVPLKPAQFVTEDDFQSLLADYPELLAGELIDPEEPRRWILVAREAGVPNIEEGSSWWSADHLFLDQDGIPTIVEVKRQSDTRLRREVVAQMIDYAANGSAYWTTDGIRAAFEETCRKDSKDPDGELQGRLGPDIDPVKFWSQVKTNLEAAKIRLLFVADVVPRELKRIVEFLNAQMSSVEVLALELRQYTGENGLRTIAPTLFGQTESSRSAKSTALGKQWDKSTFFDELASRTSPAIVDVGRKLLEWMEVNASRVVYGRGRVDGRITSYFLVNGLKLYPMTLSTQSRVYINFYDCMKPPFDEDAKRKEWLQRLNSILDLNLPADSINKYPAFQLSALAEPQRLQQFLRVMDWFANEARPSF